MRARSTSSALSPKRLQTRARLFDGFDALLRERRSDEVSVQDVAEAAGVSVGSVYVHFESKSRFVLALALDRARGETEELAAAHAGLAPAERVVALGDLLVGTATRTPAAVQLLRDAPHGYAELISSGDPLAGTAVELLRLLEAFDADVRAAHASGRVNRALHPPFTDGGRLALALRACWRGLLEHAAAPELAPAGEVAATWHALKSTLFTA